MVEAETDGLARGVDVLEISRPRDLGNIANLGLTLAEAKQLLARVQQVVVATQANDHVVLRAGKIGRLDRNAWISSTGKIGR